MDMYQKRKMRKEKRANSELDENLSKTNINCPILPNVKSALNPYK